MRCEDCNRLLPRGRGECQYWECKTEHYAQEYEARKCQRRYWQFLEDTDRMKQELRTVTAEARIRNLESEKLEWKLHHEPGFQGS